MISIHKSTQLKSLCCHSMQICFVVEISDVRAVTIYRQGNTENIFYNANYRLLTVSH